MAKYNTFVYNTKKYGATTGVDIPASDFAQILGEWGTTMNLVRETIVTDDYQNETSRTTNLYAILVILRPISKKDLKVGERGIRIEGDAILWVKTSYTVSGVIINPIPGDIIQDTEGDYWLLNESEDEPFVKTTMQFRKFIITRTSYKVD